jgi:hypothetical protein
MAAPLSRDSRITLLNCVLLCDAKKAKKKKKNKTKNKKAKKNKTNKKKCLLPELNWRPWVISSNISVKPM